MAAKYVSNRATAQASPLHHKTFDEPSRENSPIARSIAAGLHHAMQLAHPTPAAFATSEVRTATAAQHNTTRTAFVIQPSRNSREIETSLAKFALGDVREVVLSGF